MNPEQLQESLRTMFADMNVERILSALIVFVVGVALVKLIASVVVFISKRLHLDRRLRFAGKATQYALFGVITIAALNRAGIDLGVLLGAAGILTVALGFASQTSASNVISGLFLLGEKPFVIGDIIQVGEVEGTVQAIDFVSVKLRTFDNLYVRIPNETLFKANIINLTHFPIRRIDIEFPLRFDEDVVRLRELLIDAVDPVPEILDEPRANLLVIGFRDSHLLVKLTAWSTTEAHYPARTKLYGTLIETLLAHDVELPYPRRIMVDGNPAHDESTEEGSSGDDQAGSA